jgi:hypothetical protein
MPARAWLTTFTGAQEISDGSLTTAVWDAIPKLKEHLGAPISSEWEHTTG